MVVREREKTSCIENINRKGSSSCKQPALKQTVKQTKDFLYIPDFWVKMCNAHALVLALKYKGALALALAL